MFTQKITVGQYTVYAILMFKTYVFIQYVTLANKNQSIKSIYQFWLIPEESEEKPNAV